jgi:hypothetical protein
MQRVNVVGVEGSLTSRYIMTPGGRNPAVNTICLNWRLMGLRFKTDFRCQLVNGFENELSLSTFVESLVAIDEQCNYMVG